MNKSQPLIQFKPKLPRLSASEKAVLKLLVQAGKLVAPLYLEQEKQAQKGPKRLEIEKAGKNNPSVLSPYTVVEKINGKIVATPYHIKYAKLLKPIAEKLNEAASLSDNKEFGKTLKLRAKALLDGSYDEATIAQLKMKLYILDISIGPLDHFGGQLVSGKASYHCWIGVPDAEGTERLNNYKSITLSARREALLPKERIDTNNVKAKVLDVVLLSGLMARIKFVGINLPLDTGIVEKYGAQVILFNQPNDLRIKEQILPTFNKIFSSAFREGFSKEDLRRGYLRTVALHELAHSYLYYRNASKKLEDLFPVIYELAATVLGLRMAGYLLLKDRITEKMLQSMIVALICRSYHLTHEGKADKSLTVYALGGAIFINFILEAGALKQFERTIVPNFTKIFVSLPDLANILESLLARGTRKEAEVFIKRYS